MSMKYVEKNGSEKITKCECCSNERTIKIKWKHFFICFCSQYATLSSILNLKKEQPILDVQLWHENNSIKDKPVPNGQKKSHLEKPTSVFFTKRNKNDIHDFFSYNVKSTGTVHFRIFALLTSILVKSNHGSVCLKYAS